MNDGPTAVRALTAVKDELGYEQILYNDQIGKVSVVGVGMRTHPGSPRRSSVLWPTAALTCR
ncbi:aspartokinase [Cutibacterium acnes JCM 18918]|nr:aspartokinase [Cutibacterium acnes JCM 18918]